MNDFIMNYGAGLLVCAVGLFFIIMTYAAHFAGSSGVPLCGGLLIAFGFLLTPKKYLALLCFADPGWISLGYMIYSAMKKQEIEEKFQKIYAERRFAQGRAFEGVQLRVYIHERDEELLYRLYTCSLFELRIPKLYYALCCDEDGNFMVVADRGRKGEVPEILPFEDGMKITAKGDGKKDYTVELSMIVDDISDEEDEQEDGIQNKR